VEDTYETDLVERRLLEGLLDRQAAKVAERLHTSRLSGRTISVKVRLHDFSTHTRSVTLTAPTDRARVVARLARTLLNEVDTSGGVRLLGVGVSGLADWIQEELFPSDGEQAGSPVRYGIGTHGLPAHHFAPPGDPDLERITRARRWAPGTDVVHAEHGDGWVWGAGLGRVTVRFETADTAPGPVKTLRADDPDLAPRPRGRYPLMQPPEVSGRPASTRCPGTWPGS